MKKNERVRFPDNRLWLKTVLFIKVTTILYFVCLMQVSATVYSQATKFTFNAENKQIVDVLQEIEESSNFRFLYQNEQLDIERCVSIKAAGTTVEQILDELFKGEEINYKVLEDNLVILSTEDILIEKEGQILQQNTVSGTVTEESGQPLPGVTVIIKGTTQGTSTNIDGIYSIPNIPEDATLEFSFIGYSTQEVAVGNQTSINIVLVEDLMRLDEVMALLGKAI